MFEGAVPRTGPALPGPHSLGKPPGLALKAQVEVKVVLCTHGCGPAALDRQAAFLAPGLPCGLGPAWLGRGAAGRQPDGVVLRRTVG